MAVEDGWELKHDFGDRVVLVQRRFGSMSGHLLVGIFTLWWTMGVGNVLYGTYRYLGDADRLVVRIDSERTQQGDDTRAQQTGENTNRHVQQAPDATDRHVQQTVDSEGGASMLSRRTAGVYWLLAVALFAAGTLVSSTMVTGAFIVLAGLAAVAGTAMMPSVTERTDRRYPLSTFGEAHSVDERTVADPDQPCSACTEPVDPGIKRTYYRDQCLFGLPLSTESGENYYCKACANGEQVDTSEPTDDSNDQTEISEPTDDSSDQTEMPKPADDSGEQTETTEVENSNPAQETLPTEAES